MPEVSRLQLVLYAVALCAIVWLGARYLSQDADVPVAAGGGGGSGAAPGLELNQF